MVANLRNIRNDMVHSDINFTRLVHMIGRWTLSPLSSMFYIPLELVGRVMIDYVGRLKKRSFEVKSFYKVLLPNVDSSFPWKSIWRTKAPLRLAFEDLLENFNWTTSLGKISL
jgi:hypothetical protein